MSVTITNLVNTISDWLSDGATVDLADGAVVTLNGSMGEVASEQDIEPAGTVETYNRGAGATQIEVYCESGYVRIRTDGDPCTSTTGEPLSEGFAACWSVPSISVYYTGDSTITVVSR